MEMSVEHMSVGAAGVDDLACYRVEVAPIYQCLRQVLIQLAGLAILAQGRQSAGWPDHPTLTAAGKRLKEAFDGVNSVRVPNAVSHSHVFLGQCVADLQWVLERMLDVGEKALEGGSGSGIAVHEERLRDEFPSSIDAKGLRVSEICLGQNETSKVA
jgi:hypothetical protein